MQAKYQTVLTEFKIKHFATTNILIFRKQMVNVINIKI